MSGNNGRERISLNKDDSTVGEYKDYLAPDFNEVLTVGVVNRDREIGARALFLAENRLAKDIESHHGIRGLVDKIWKGGIARSYYRQKYANQARHDILTSQSLLLDHDDAERKQYDHNFVRTFLDQAEGVIDETIGDERHSLLVENPALLARIRNVVERYASGEITDTEIAKSEFDNLIKNLDDSSKDHLLSTNISEIVAEARNRYESLMTIAEATASRLDHDDAMTRIMAGFDVLYGKRQTANIETHYSKADRLIDKIQNSKVGCLVSPETVSLATGAAISVAEFFGKRATSAIFATIPGLGGALLGGAAASTNFDSERMRAKFDLRYSREFNDNDKRRQEILETVHPHYGAEDLANDLERRVSEIRASSKDGGNTEARQNSLVSAIARCQYYLELDRTENPVLRYSSEVKAPAEQLKLIQRLVRAKNYLRANGIADLDDRLSKESEVMQGVIDEVEQSATEANTAARKLKTRRILKRMGTGLLTGVAIGLATQEIGAYFNPRVQGILETKGKGQDVERTTIGKRIVDYLKRHFISQGKESPVTNDTAEINSLTAANLVRSADGTFNLMNGNNVVASGIDWNSQTGEMTEASIQKLASQGIKVSQTDYIQQTIEEEVTKTQTSQVPIDEYYKKMGDAFGKVKRIFWYDNNTDKSDLNELRLSHYTDPTTGKFGFISGMSDFGSKHKEKIAKFSELARNGKIKLMISPTRGTQQSPIEVSGTLLSNGQLAFIPSENSIAASFFDSNGKFIGKFAEIVEDLGKDGSETTLIAPLATIVGEGYKGTLPLMETVTETVEKTIDIPQYTFIPPILGTTEGLPTQPMIFPFSVEGVMKSSAHRKNYFVGLPQYAARDYAGGYQEGTTEEALGGDRGSVLKKDVLPALLEGKKITLKEGVAWHHDQIRRIGGDDYADDIEQKVQNCPDFSKLDQDVKVVVTIPVHAPTEYNNIYKTLSLYANQEGVDPKSFMIFLDLNWRQTENGTAEEVQNNIQKTYDEISRFRQDFPDVKLATINQTGHKGIHDVVRVMNDTLLSAIHNAIQDGRMQGDNDILIVRNDADVKHLNKRYIASFREAMQKNPKTPLFTGTTWFNINRQKTAPAFGSVLMIERMTNLLASLNGRIHTAGGNFAYRAAQFSAISAYGTDDGWEMAGADDLKVGFRVNNALSRIPRRPYDEDGLLDADTKMLVRVGGATLDTDDARYLKFYATPGDYVINDAYRATPLGYNANPIRPEDIQNFVEIVGDRQSFNGIVESFEQEMSDFFSIEGGDAPILDRTLSWWFGGPTDNLYTVTPTDEVRFDEKVYRFKLTEEGKQRYRESLLERMGDGLSLEDRNNLQRAISSGAWLSPVSNP